MTEPPTPICIIGMHRSGTSMIVRLLNLCGLDLGPAEELIGPNESNPLGHFEHLGFFRVNEALLEHFDGSWDDPPTLQADWEYDPSVDPIVEQGRAVLRSFSKGSHWGWKDPRTTILLPFWKSLVPNLRFVLCMRSPLEVAKSLARRDRIPLRRGIYLWNQYTQAAIRDTEGEPRMFIFYEDFFKNPAGEIDRLVEFCGLQKPDDLSGLYAAISDELRHHTSETSDLLNNTSVITEYKLLYIGLRALCTESFIELSSHRKREDLISENIDQFFKLLEKFHHEQEILQIQSFLADKEQQLTRFQFVVPIRQRTLARRDKEIRDFRNVVAHREARIDELQAAVQAQQQVLAQREVEVNELRQALAHREGRVDELQAAVQAQQQVLAQREVQINELRQALAHREGRVDELQAAVQAQQQVLAQREVQVNEQRQALAHREVQVDELQVAVQAQQQVLLKRSEQLEQITQQLEGIQTSRNQKEEQVRLLTTEKEWFTHESARLQAELNLVYSTLGWKVVTLYFRFRDAILPPKTRRRKIYDWIVRNFKGDKQIQKKTVKATSNDGGSVETLPKKFGRKGNDRSASRIWKMLTGSNFAMFDRGFRPYNHNSRYKRGKRTISEINGDLLNDRGETGAMTREPIYRGIVDQWVETTVSVVIPVKNAGEGFYHLLAMLKGQKGFKAVEIIAVDSGSTDATLEIAEEFGAKIVQILPEEFSHSYARNLGAKYASGEYLLFTVQDALPPSDVWLQELLSVIKEKGVAAVSCAEFPREDADLFYRTVSWNHYRFLGVDGQDRIMSDPGDDNYLSLRKNAQLSDIACLISREVFSQYWFRRDYGEDLDLGIRLIKDGYSLALLGSTRIIHSHNRPAFYHLKRAYVDNLCLPQILPSHPSLAIASDKLFPDIVRTYHTLNSLVADELPRLTLPCPVQALRQLVMEKFRPALHGKDFHGGELAHSGCIDDLFKSFLDDVSNHRLCRGQSRQSDDSVLLEAMQNFMKTFFEYMERSYEILDDFVIEDFKSCLYKTFAYLCGVHLAYCFSALPLENIDNETQKMLSQLREGI